MTYKGVNSIMTLNSKMANWHTQNRNQKDADVKQNCSGLLSLACRFKSYSCYENQKQKI